MSCLATLCAHTTRQGCHAAVLQKWVEGLLIDESIIKIGRLQTCEPLVGQGDPRMVEKFTLRVPGWLS